jgi:tetratricopeptide (TPR) repeat protein
MRTIFIFLFIFCVNFVFAQDLENLEEEKGVELSVLIQNAQYKQAIAWIDSQEEPTKGLFFQKAMCYKNLSDNSTAIAILESLADTYPDDIPVRLQLASCYESAFLLAKSIDCYDNLIKIDSINTYFKVRKADLLYRSEKYSESLKNYAQIDSEYNPNYIIRSIAMCYEKMDETDLAKSCYEEAWEINRKDAYSALSLVKIHIKKEDHEFALRDSETFLQTDSTNLQMYILNALTYYNLSNYDESIKRFEKCRAMGDSSLLVNRSLGLSYYFLNDHLSALPCLNQAYRQDSLNNNVLYVLATINTEVGNYPEAIEQFDILVQRILPNKLMLYTAYKGLGLAYQKNEMFQEAYSGYVVALQYASYIQSWELYYTLGNLSYYDIEDYNTAIFHYEKYKASLMSYLNALKTEMEKEENKDENREEKDKEIRDIEKKISALNQHIQTVLDVQKRYNK